MSQSEAIPELILHHYAVSPFSEKIRSILGYKRLAWKSVQMPAVLPKADLVAMTGGYRRAPVLQIGCDIYCDSKLIASVIDRLQPQPPLVPHGLEASCEIFDHWSEQVLFFLFVPVVFQPAGLAQLFAQVPGTTPEQFQKDRQPFLASGVGRRPAAAITRSELPAFLTRIDQQLATWPFLLGEAPTLADFGIYHPVWFVLANKGVTAYLDRWPHLIAWAKRMAALGQGQCEDMESAQALEIARTSAPRSEGLAAMPDPAGLKIGDTVRVSTIDYGADAVISGALQFSAADEFAIARSDARAGDVIVHFPRVGYRLEAAK